MSGTKQAKLKNGPCDCCGEPGGCGNCCLTFWCPCYSFYLAAENIGDDNGLLYCIGTLLGFGCCMLTVLGQKVAERQGVDMGIGKSMCCACCDCCVCYSCAIGNESELIKLANADGGGEPVVAVQAEVMEDRKE
mmetsp:Transcript_25792/g.29801  ORF Transcript_25792/g.29801 Transcript_25792/m.29801 type:complete len:134 (-) Transcript_25792:386-787(-)